MTSAENLHFSSVQERILLEKQIHVPSNQLNGPTTELFFHEIKEKNSAISSLINILAGMVLVLIHLLTLPLISLLLKLSGKNIFDRFRGIKQGGAPVSITWYNTGFREYSDLSGSEPDFIQKFLYKSGLFKLPMAHHLLRQNISLVGPQVVSEEEGCEAVNRLTDFYKRFALKPGYFYPVCYKNTPDEDKQLKKAFQQELRFILQQT